MHLRVCADLYGNKVNLEVDVPATLDLVGLRELIGELMLSEGEMLRSPNQPQVPFTINGVQMFHDQVGQWVDLMSMNQLRDNMQLYVFQPQTQFHADIQGDLPPPRPPTAATTSRGPPIAVPKQPIRPMGTDRGSSRVQFYEGGGGNNTSGNDGVEPSEEEKLRYLFEEMDAERAGRVSLVGFKAWMRKFVDFNDEALELMFATVDPQRGGWAGWAEFAGLSKRFPNVCDIVFHRAADSWDVMSRELEIQQSQQQLQTNAAREDEIRQQIAALESQLQSIQQQTESLHSTIQSGTNLNQATASRQEAMHGEEQSLMERELNMERHREALRDSELLFLEQSQHYNRAATALGSPRRARQY